MLDARFLRGKQVLGGKRDWPSRAQAANRLQCFLSIGGWWVAAGER